MEIFCLLNERTFVFGNKLSNHYVIFFYIKKALPVDILCVYVKILNRMTICVAFPTNRH